MLGAGAAKGPSGPAVGSEDAGGSCTHVFAAQPVHGARAAQRCSLATP